MNNGTTQRPEDEEAGSFFLPDASELDSSVTELDDSRTVTSQDLSSLQDASEGTSPEILWQQLKHYMS